jgi:hypothetical protein
MRSGGEGEREDRREREGGEVEEEEQKRGLCASGCQFPRRCLFEMKHRAFSRGHSELANDAYRTVLFKSLKTRSKNRG